VALRLSFFDRLSFSASKIVTITVHHEEIKLCVYNNRNTVLVFPGPLVTEQLCGSVFFFFFSFAVLGFELRASPLLHHLSYSTSSAVWLWTNDSICVSAFPTESWSEFVFPTWHEGSEEATSLCGCIP
jgi:hypothetical protein